MGHSDKAMKTLEEMGTRPDQWKGADIDVHREKRMVWVARGVTCPGCKGRRYVVRDEAGNEMQRPEFKDFGRGDAFDRDAYNAACLAYNKAQAAAYHGGRGNCDQCKDRRRYSTGKVGAMMEREVLIAIVKWPPGVKYDSRFSPWRRDVVNSHCCELCAKSISKSGRVPVVGVGDDGVVHGMWVGEDCAKRFLPGVTRYVKKGDEKGKDLIYEEAA